MLDRSNLDPQGDSRECDGCEACCFLLGVPGLKPEMSRCQHSTGEGCGIYGERPRECHFVCEWKRDSNGRVFTNGMKPDLSGVMVRHDVADLAKLKRWGVDPKRHVFLGLCDVWHVYEGKKGAIRTGRWPKVLEDVKERAILIIRAYGKWKSPMVVDEVKRPSYVGGGLTRNSEREGGL